MSGFPEPLVGPEVDLRDFKYMPLVVERLRKSKQWLISRRKPEIGFYSLNLWVESWHEFPAGSLEDDDDVLADKSMCNPRNWNKVKQDVMRGWIKCSDGRLYHPVVAELALEAWDKKLQQRGRTEAARLERQRRRQSVTTSVTETVTDNVTEVVTSSKGREEKNIERERVRASVSTISEPLRVIAEFDRLLVQIWGEADVRHFPDSTDSVYAQRMLDAGASVEFIAETMAHHMDQFHRDGQKPPKRVSTFETFVLNAIKRRDRPPGKRVNGATGNGHAAEQIFDQEFERWKAKVGIFREKGTWQDRYGPKPGEPGCRAPPELLIGLVQP